MTIIEILLLICFFTNLGLGLLIFTRPSNYYKKINIIFSSLCLASALWVLGALMVPIFIEVHWKLFWIRFIFGVSGFIPAIFLHFSLIFPNYQYTINLFRQLLIYSPSLFFLIISQTEFIVISIIQLEPLKFKYGLIHNIFSIYLVTYLCLGLLILLNTHRKSTGIYRLQIKYCFFGMLLSSITGLITNILLPLLGTSKYSAIGPSFTMIMVGFTTYSIL
ncbi:MAG: histidine kinase N-terminal 7TM domain-containing protein, partial [Thermodesulfobacteriota bacterium]|nr:histidine kinase N-terminal 7TM domain-containing protein [Thermodesulfobacteriota bacterium]